MRLILAVLVLALAPAAATAGAWPREVGTAFVSLTHTLSDDIDRAGVDTDGYTALYFEYGATPRLTFGIDAGTTNNGEYVAIVFARHALDWELFGGKTALQGGAGAAEIGGNSDTLLELGAAWGRGLATRFGGGWLGIDTKLHYFTEAEDTAAKVDVTLGVKPNDRTMVILQLQASDYPGSDPSLALVPSVVRKVGKRNYFELGLDVGLVNDSTAGVKFGTSASDGSEPG